jgi:hypothetical protein
VQEVEPAVAGAAANDAPVTPKEVAVAVIVPPQVVVVGPTTVTPVGKLFEKVKPLIDVALKLLSVSVRLLFVPATIDAGENTSATVAAVWTTTDPDMAAVFVAPSVLVTPVAAMLFVAVALKGVVFGLRATTSTLIVQLLPAAIVPPLNPTDVPEPAAVTVPPHVFARLGAGANCSWAGKLSVNAIPVSAMVLAWDRVIVICAAAPPPWILAALKVLVPVIGLMAATKSVALAEEAVPPILLVTLAGGIVLT